MERIKQKNSRIIKVPKRKVYAVDLFCGAGGLTNGLERSGISVRLGVDIDPASSYPYTQNNKAKFLLKDVEELKAHEVQQAFRKNGIRLLAGCAPCQTFSTYNQKADESDKRWWLLKQFSRLVQEITPELVTMENVPGLVKQNVFNEFIRNLESNNYYVNYCVVNCDDYGIPQVRKRLVLLASRLGPINLLTPTELDVKRLTVRDAIGDLPPIQAGETHDEDHLHTSSSLTNINLKRIKSSKPGGTWLDWDSELLADCHKKDTGKTYQSVYGRMVWDEPAPTMTTQFYGFGNGRFGHPEQDRAISLREGAILQGFSRNYEFVRPGEEVVIKTIGRLIGNAVPVKLGEVIGLSIQAHVAQYEAKLRRIRRQAT